MPVDKIFQNTSRAETAGALAKHGIEVEAICGYRSNQHVDISGFSKVHYMYMHSNGIRGKLQSLLRLVKMICRIQSDVVIFSIGLAFLIPILRLYCFLTGSHRILVADIRSLIVPEENHIAPLWPGRFTLCLRLADRFADVVTTITPALKESIAKYLPRKKDSILIWESGVNCDLFDPRRAKSIRNEFAQCDDFVVIYHGVLGKTRGLQELVRSFCLLRDMNNIKLLLVGDGGGRTELEQIARENGITDQVLFTGKVSYTEIPNYLASADLAVIPLPNNECWNVSSPLKLMEYLSMNVPVIATNIESHSKVVGAFGGGMLIDSNAPEAIAGAIRAVVSRTVTIAPAKDDVRNLISWDAKTFPLVSYFRKLKNM